MQKKKIKNVKNKSCSPGSLCSLFTFKIILKFRKNSLRNSQQEAGGGGIHGGCEAEGGDVVDRDEREAEFKV